MLQSKRYRKQIKHDNIIIDHCNSVKELLVYDMQSKYTMLFVAFLIASLLSSAVCSPVVIYEKTIGCPPECGTEFKVGTIMTGVPIEEIIKDDGNCVCTKCPDGEQKPCCSTSRIRDI